MKHWIEFTKASGAGNDFVLVNNWDGTLDVNQFELAAALCSRPFGVGADGLLVLQKSSKAHFQMCYYNADGSYGGMCGNGGRCIARYAYLFDLAPQSMTFEALDHVYSAEVIGERVRLKMKQPTDFRPEVRLEIAGQPTIVQFINTGSPHVVLMLRDVDSFDVQGWGASIRNNPLFLPEGTNVNFVRIVSPDTIQVRTYERGVEGETLACGTGSVAGAAVAHITKGMNQPVHVRVKSGEELLVYLEGSDGKITDASLEGSAHILFEGRVFYDDTSHSISTSS
jgi:diaminopimelate epimerase